jgi:transposase
MRTLALDLGKTSVDWCEVSEGRVIGRGRVKNVESLRSVLGADEGPIRIGFEACREALHVHELLLSWGHQPLVFDTTRVRRLAGIGEHGRKNDRIDAERLALALEREHLALAHVLSEDGRRLRELQELHRALVQTRKRLVVHARGVLRGRGIDLPSCAVEDVTGHLRKIELTDAMRPLISSLLVPLEAIQPEIARIDLQIHELCVGQQDPVITRLASIPGVSLLVASAFISAIDDASRFQNASQVSSFLGLCPREESTGGRQKLGSITKQGNSYARCMLVQAAWCVIRSHDTKDALVRWAHKTSQRRGRMRAAVAVARRLSRIMWSMWVNGTFYDPRGMTSLDEHDADRAKNAERSSKRGELKLSAQQRANRRRLQASLKLSEGRTSP